MSDLKSDTVGDVVRRTATRLDTKGVLTARLDAELLVAHVLGISRSALALERHRELTVAQAARVTELAARRAAHEPLQYILGEWGFRHLTLTVDERALIPRPETETVVERCLELLKGIAAPRVLDVGTGSGAIALSIADEHPGARVTAIDVSLDAIALARENALRTGIELELLEVDMLSGLPGADWDLVVSNPPYVRPDEASGLAPEVVEWEPHVALFDGGHTELLVREAARVLRVGGALVLESFDERALAVAQLLEGAGFADVIVTRDLAGRDRVVEGRLQG
ncbi:MAG TPA: peptide chain release factor N(5)-glutamine methyltransferase [Gaiella sp.]|nr:peptide chain release factor N(5)-glutamine methyltransferase [Gaiella sp.]